MVDRETAKTQIQQKHSSDSDKYRNTDAEKLLNLLGNVDIDDLQVALEAIKTAKEASPSQDKGNKNYIDKTAVYEDRDAYIYKRGDTKSGIWYFRIFDVNSRKPVFKSLKTTDKTAALAAARVLYIDIKGKIDRGERIKQITTNELVDKWIEILLKQITPIPHEGITAGTFKSKKYFLNTWRDYINNELKLSNVSIDRIKPEVTRNFGNWMKAKPKQTSIRTGNRGGEQINNIINEVTRMYHQLAVREKYISVDNIPQIDKIKYQISDAIKRDIFTLEQYNVYTKYLTRVYVTKKHNPSVDEAELEKRKIFTEYILLIASTGHRSKELLGTKFGEVYQPPTFSEDEKQTHVAMTVRRDNAKTGRERRVIARVKKRIDRIIASYKKLGITHQPDDFLFINPLSKDRNHYGRMIMYQRLKKTLVDSGLQKELDLEKKSISPYSFRHFYCYMRLINHVPIHLLAKNMGTSVQKIEAGYGHINTELHADVITKGQSIIKSTDLSLETLDTLDSSNR